MKQLGKGKERGKGAERENVHKEQNMIVMAFSKN